MIGLQGGEGYPHRLSEKWVQTVESVRGMWKGQCLHRMECNRAARVITWETWF